ncbi:hypothetical protein BC828DRAFT_440331 [Blastocladiella britannica]|nr:hypothetical protein BC828DRAFT_440331 [Blastocladiella britannica]
MNMMRAGMTAAAGCASTAAIVVKAAVDPFGLYNSSLGWWPVIVAAAVVGFVLGAAFAKWQTSRCLASTVRAWRQMLSDAAVLSAPDSKTSLSKHHPSSFGAKTEPMLLPKPIGSALLAESEPSMTSSARGNASSILRQVHMSAVQQVQQYGGRAPAPTTIAALALVQSAEDMSNTSGSLNQRRRSPSIAESLCMPPASIVQLCKQQHQPDSENVVLAKLNRGGSTELLGAFNHREPKRRTAVFDSAHQVEICLRFVRANPTAQQLTLGLQLLERGMVEFPKDPLLMLLSSTYLAAYYGTDGETAADQLMRGLYLIRGGMPLDVKFLAFSRDRASRERGAHVLDRAAIESMEREVRVHHLHALYLVRDIWELIRISSTTTRLALAVTQLAVHMTGASTAYVRLLERNPRDKRLLRMYSQYLLLVEADAIRAAQVLDIAEDVEIQEARMRRVEVVPASSGGVNDIQVSVSHISDDDHESEDKVRPASAMSDNPVRSDAAIMMPPDATKVPPPSHEDAFDTRHILWKSKHALPSPSQQPSFSSLPPGVITIQARTGRGGSQTSGTSMSRAERQRISMRRVLNERVARPLNLVHTLTGLSCGFLVTMVVGFAVCMQMFSATITVINVNFFVARSTRRLILTVIESVRMMVFLRLGLVATDFAASYATLKSTLNTLTTSMLPMLADMWVKLPTPPLVFRVFKATVDGDLITYQAFSLDALQISQAVVQAGQSALVFNKVGQLSPAVAGNTPEIRFLTDNIDTIFAATRTLTQTAVDAYNRTVTDNMTILLSAMVAALVFLAATYTFTYQQTLQSYFVGETQILKLVLGTPKKLASALVLSLEEEIESFKELVDSDNDLMSDIDFKTLPSSETRGKDVRHRGKRFAIQILLGFSVVAAFSIGMYAQALSSLDLSKGFARWAANTDRRLTLLTTRIFANEWESDIPTVSNDQISKVIQGAILDMVTNNNFLYNDPGGLQAQFPALTTQPRDCVTVACPGVVPQPEVGYTLAMANLPLNSEIARYQEVLTRMGYYMANFSLTQPPPGPPVATYLLLKALVADLDNRLGALTNAIMNQFLAQINTASTTTVILFICVVALFVCGVLAFMTLILKRLRREAHVVTTLLYMIPQGSQKEVVGLEAFLETGGLLLRAHTSDD